jgi:hypothetical protein
MALCREIPVDFIAANSYFSAKFPNTIRLETKIVKGNTSGINFGEKYIKNFKTTIMSKPFPASSEIYNQIVWSIKMNIRIRNTLIKVRI